MDYRIVLREHITSDFQRGCGIYSPDLDIHSALIRIPDRAGFLIPHSVHEIRSDPDQYLDNYLIVALLWQELYEH